MPRNPFTIRKHAEIFAHVRSLPDRLLKQYMHIFSMISDPRQILDVGGGTGQFTVALAKTFPLAVVEGIEPASAMFRKMKDFVQRSQIGNVRLVSKRLEDISPIPAYDFVLLSEVSHLFDNGLDLVRRLRTLLMPKGVIAIRTSSHSQLIERDWYRFFPHARLIDLERHHSLELLKEAFRLSGFHVSEIVVDESRDVPALEFATLLTQRGYSTLHLITETDFQSGCDYLQSVTRENSSYYFDYKMTLLVAHDNQH